MSRWQLYSLIVILSFFLLIGVWDAVAYYYGGGRKSTISYLFTMGTYHAPIVAFLFGVLAGHLFWPQTSYQSDVTPEKRTEITVDEKGNVKAIRSWHVENH